MEQESKKYKILTITPRLNVCGGIESYVMNYYSRIHNEFKMDFITHEISDNTYNNIIEKNGDSVYLFPKLGLNVFKVKKLVKKFFEEHHDYDIIHCHMANAAFLYLSIAKKYGIKVRIIHSHQNKAADILSHAIRNIPLIRIGVNKANVYFACSKPAGKYLFKNKDFYLINNAIDPERFNYNPTIRKKIREELNIDDDCFLVGNVGRLCPQKNQEFLIDVFYLVNQKINSKLIIIGEGELEKNLKTHIKELGLKDKVIIHKPVKKIEDYYQAMDIFVLPSLYEGIGIVNIEAQACGLKVIVSERVPEIAKISDLLSFMKLSAGEEAWAKRIIKESSYERKNQKDILKKSNFDIDDESKKLEDLYVKLIEAKK